MKVDFSEEFRNFEQLEFDSAISRHDYIHQLLMNGMSVVVNEALDWLDQNVKDSRWEDREAERRFFEARLVELFGRRFVSDQYGVFMRDHVMRVMKIKEDRAAQKAKEAGE